MKTSLRLVLAPAFAVIATLAPHVSGAQSRLSVAVDVTAGGGFARGGEFRDSSIVGARLGVSLRRWQSARFGLFVEGSMDWLGLPTGPHLDCALNSHGHCVGDYPSLAGPSAVVGLLAARIDRRLEMRAGLGAAAYSSTYGPRVGAAVGQVDAAVFPVTHVGIVLGARWIVVPRYRGDQLSMLPWMIGLRVR